MADFTSEMPLASPEVSQKIVEAYGKPLKVGPITLKNGFIKAATNEGMCPKGVPTQALLEFHAGIAAGGASLTTMAYCAVSKDGRTFDDQLVMDQETLPHLKAIARAVHANGGKLSAQLSHGGCFTLLQKLEREKPLSSTGGFNVTGFASSYFWKQEMKEPEMQEVIDEYVRAASIARAAGMDAVELHMGHGYLLSQFLSPLYNDRTDEYGGSVVNRCRFPRRVLRAVLDAVGDEIAVIVKFSMIEGTTNGHTPEDALIVAKELSDEGAHLIVLSAGMNIESTATLFGAKLPTEVKLNKDQSCMIRLGAIMQSWIEPNREFKELYNLDQGARLIKESLPTAPLCFVGGAKSPESIAQLADMGFQAVALGRTLVNDAHYVENLLSGAARQTRCISCQRCVGTMYWEGGIQCVWKEKNDPRKMLVGAGDSPLGKELALAAEEEGAVAPPQIVEVAAN